MAVLTTQPSIMVFDEVAQSINFEGIRQSLKEAHFLLEHFILRWQEFIQLDLSMLNFYWLIFTDSHILLVYYFLLSKFKAIIN